jgi:hypothetical protein
VPWATGVARRWMCGQKSAEGIVGLSTGPKAEYGTWDGEPEFRWRSRRRSAAAMSVTTPESRGRNPERPALARQTPRAKEHPLRHGKGDGGGGRSENMTAAWKQVLGTRVAGVDGTTVHMLLPFLRREWPRIKENCWRGVQAHPVRGWVSPSLAAGCFNWVPTVWTAHPQACIRSCHRSSIPASPNPVTLSPWSQCAPAVFGTRIRVRRATGVVDMDWRSSSTGQPRCAHGTRGAQGRRQAGVGLNRATARGCSPGV